MKKNEKEMRYNFGRYRSILNLINDNKLSHALTELEKYIEDYPNDIDNALYEYGVILFKLKNPEKAIEVLNKVYNNTTNNYTKYLALELLGRCYKKTFKFKEAKKQFKTALIYEKELGRFYSSISFANLSIREGKFKEAENILLNINNISNANMGVLALYIYELAYSKFLQGNKEDAKTILNQLSNNDLNEIKKDILNKINILKKHLNNNTMSYYDSQLAHYNKDLAIQHIIDRHVKTKEFSDDINVVELLNNMESMIIYDDKICNINSDSYIFEYQGVFIKVICLPDTKNVITMYPYDEFNFNEESFDEDFEETKEENIVPEKTLIHVSQIDKFNNRYKGKQG